MAEESQVFGFRADDVKRIGSAVRVVERGQTMQVQPQMDSASVRQFPIFLGTAGGDSWSKLTSKTVTIYSGTPHSTTGIPPTSAMTLKVYNIFCNFQSSTSIVTRWVAVSNNGWGWYLIESECNPHTTA